MKIARRAADLHFLKNCHDNNLIPPFAQINHILHNKYNSKAFFQLRISLIWAEIKRGRASLDNLACSVLSAHLKLASNINKDLWSIIDARAALKAINEGHIAQKRQHKKLSNLLNRSHYKDEKLNNAIEISTDSEGLGSIRMNSNDNILSHGSSSDKGSSGSDKNAKLTEVQTTNLDTGDNGKSVDNDYQVLNSGNVQDAVGSINRVRGNAHNVGDIGNNSDNVYINNHT